MNFNVFLLSPLFKQIEIIGYEFGFKYNRFIYNSRVFHQNAVVTLELE